MVLQVATSLQPLGSTSLRFRLSCVPSTTSAHRPHNVLPRPTAPDLLPCRVHRYCNPDAVGCSICCVAHRSVEERSFHFPPRSRSSFSSLRYTIPCLGPQH